MGIEYLVILCCTNTPNLSMHSKRWGTLSDKFWACYIVLLLRSGSTPFPSPVVVATSSSVLNSSSSSCHDDESIIIRGDDDRGDIDTETRDVILRFLNTQQQQNKKVVQHTHFTHPRMEMAFHVTLTRCKTVEMQNGCIIDSLCSFFQPVIPSPPQQSCQRQRRNQGVNWEI